MIVQDNRLVSTHFAASLSVQGAAPLSLAALHLGSQGRHDWHQLQHLGPIHYSADGPTDPLTNTAGQAFQHDFGDSLVQCASNAPASSVILPHHLPCDPRHIPAAMGFAFAQQWARFGLACIHGALLEVASTGVLVLGQRGAGKSVLATSALVAGGGIVSDDYLLAGELDGTLTGERIRSFLSLRASWAARTLFDNAPGAWRSGRTGSRSFLGIEDDDPRFPEHCRINRVWILSRPRAGRREDSTLEPTSQAELYTALVNATQPLLLGPDFPHERNRLTQLFSRLAGLAPARLETGQDIVLDPQATWQRLLALANSPHL